MGEETDRAMERIQMQHSDRSLTGISRLIAQEPSFTSGNRQPYPETDREDICGLSDHAEAGQSLLHDDRSRNDDGSLEAPEASAQLTGSKPAGELSTFGQTLFNACNVLLGVGLLSLPYAMRLCGWAGLVVQVLLSALTCHTAKILGRIQDYVPAEKLRDGPAAYTILGFHDMAQLVFGTWGKLFISVLFIAETFGFCCVFLIIEGENLSHQLKDFPAFAGWQKEHFMSLSAIIFLPSCLLRNLSWLAYFSAVGVFSSLCLLFGIIATGLMDQVLPVFDAQPSGLDGVVNLRMHLPTVAPRSRL